MFSLASGLICQTRMRLSTPPATTRLPSGLKATQYSSLSGWPNVSSRSPLATSHSLTVRSPLALASNLAVGAKRQVEDRVVVPGERAQFLAAGRVPQLDLLIVAAGGQQLAVGAEHGRIQAVLMSVERAHQLAVGRRSTAALRRTGPARPPRPDQLLPSVEKPTAFTRPRCRSNLAQQRSLGTRRSSTVP